MPIREKALVIVLALIFSFSSFQFFSHTVRFGIKNEENVFSEGFVGHIAHINPLSADFNDADRDIAKLIFSGLVKFDPKKKNFIPDLAEKWERSKDGLSYIFTLRQDAFWHDGTPVTVEDALFTFRDVIQHPTFRNPILRNILEKVKIQKTGNMEITFTLPKANSYFPSHLTIGLIPKHLLQETSPEDLATAEFNEHPVGSGPYRVSGVSLSSDGDRIDFESFSQFYGEKPAQTHMRIYTFPNEKDLIASREALSSISRIPASSGAAETLQTDERFLVSTYTLNQFTALYFNTDREFFKDKNARQALVFALDKASLVAAGEERMDTLDFKITKTKAPAAAADKQIPKTLHLLIHEKIPLPLAEKIKEQWGKIGMEVNIEQEDAAGFSSRIRSRKYDLLLIRQNLGYNRDAYPLFHSSQISETGQNFANFRSFRTDGFTEAIRKEKDPTQKEKLFQELSNVIAEEIPVVFFSSPVYIYAVARNFEPFPVKSLDYHADRFLITPYLKKL